MTRKKPTIFEDCFPTVSIYFLPTDEETGGVSKVDVAGFSMVVDSSGVDEVLYWYHVLITGLNVHVQASDDPRSPLTVEQEKIVFGFYKTETERDLYSYCQLIGVIHQC